MIVYGASHLHSVIRGQIIFCFSSDVKNLSVWETGKLREEESKGRNSRTLVTSVFHQPAGDADDVLEHGFRQVFQHHLLLDLQLLIHTDGVQDEDGGNGFTVAGQEAAELRLQQLFALLKARFLHRKQNFLHFQGIYLLFSDT